MRWQLTAPEGWLAGYPLAEVLANGGVLDGAPVVAPADPLRPLAPELLAERVAPYTRPGRERHHWLVLPDNQREHRAFWAANAGDGPEPGFGRAHVTLALRQMISLGQPARLVAVDRVAIGDEWTDSVLAMDWQPAAQGLGMIWSQLDGRLDGKTDVGAMLQMAADRVPCPELLLCPGNISDGAMERLLPFLSSLGQWTAPSVRWEFAEARVGPLGVVGALYSWFWLQDGYRLGEWRGVTAVMDMDQSPLVGLSLVDYQ